MNERITGQITSDCHTLIDMNAKPIGMVDIFCADYDSDIATAKRLAACWNACEHLTDEGLSEGVVSVKKLRENSIEVHARWNSMRGDCFESEDRADGGTSAIREVYENITGTELETQP